MSGGTISGGKNQPDVYMAWEKNSVSGTAKFTVKGNFPFASMKIESASKINEIDFTKATATGEENLQINLPWDGNETGANMKLSKPRPQIIGISLNILHCQAERLQSLQYIMSV